MSAQGRPLNAPSGDIRQAIRRRFALLALCTAAGAVVASLAWWLTASAWSVLGVTCATCTPAETTSPFLTSTS